MSDNKLHVFISKLSKQKKIKTTVLAELCGLSRTTLYRYSKGLIQITPKVESALAEALCMTSKERDEFRRLISVTVQDGSLISSRYVLDRLFFGGPTDFSSPARDSAFTFAFHQNDSYLRSTQELIDMFLKHSDKEAFRCEVKVINCIDEKFQSNLQSMLKKLLSASDAVSVEHLLAFPQKDHLKCTETLLAIIPLLGFLNYNVLYSETNSDSGGVKFLNDTVIVETFHSETKQNIRQFFVLSYLSGALPQSTAFSDEYLYRFFMENYNNCRAACKYALIGAKSISGLSEYLLGLEVTAEQCLIKPDICYNKIPVEICRAMIESAPLAAKQTLALNNPESINNFLSAIDIRFQHAYKKGNIDVFSKSGLIAFTKTGVLSDHIEGLPPFDAASRKIILQTLRNNIIDGAGYRLNIIEKEINLVIGAFKDVGLIIEFADTILKGNCENIFIQNKMLADVFFDYAANHVPAYHAMETREAISFLDGLIDSLTKMT